jgi:hypothetical protein
MLIAAIPMVGLIMICIYAFGNDPDQNPNRKNWAKAQLIIMALFFALAIGLMIVFGALFAAIFANNPQM